MRRPIKDLDELFGAPKSQNDADGIMGRDVETMVTVDRILEARERLKKQTAGK